MTVAMLLVATLSACGDDGDVSEPVAATEPTGASSGPPPVAPDVPDVAPTDAPDGGGLPFGDGFDASEILPPLRGEDDVMGADLIGGPCVELGLFQQDVIFTVMEADAYLSLGQPFNHDESIRRITNLYDAIPPDDLHDDVHTVFEQVTLRLTIMRDTSFQPTGGPGDQQAIQAMLASGGYDDTAFLAAWESTGAAMFDAERC